MICGQSLGEGCVHNNNSTLTKQLANSKKVQHEADNNQDVLITVTKPWSKQNSLSTSPSVWIGGSSPKQRRLNWKSKETTTLSESNVMQAVPVPLVGREMVESDHTSAEDEYEEEVFRLGKVTTQMNMVTTPNFDTDIKGPPFCCPSCTKKFKGVEYLKVNYKTNHGEQAG